MPTPARISPQPATSEAEIRGRIDTLIMAIRAMDLDGVMPIYAPDIVSFDIEPPLRHVGAQAKRKNWTAVFTSYQRPLDYEVRDLAIIVDGSVAFAHGLARMSGTLKSGVNKGYNKGYWVRWTSCFRRINGAWLIVHDQVSVPLDVASGRVLRDLEP